MTRRIALAILLTVWAILVVGGVAAYAAVRWALIEQLDQSLVAKASSLPQLGPLGAGRGAPDDGTAIDRYVIRSPTKTLSAPTGSKGVSDVRLVSASFSTLGDGSRLRTVTLQGTAQPDDGPPVPVTINYQSSAAALDHQLNRLALLFSLFGLGAGLLTAFVALRVSRSALKPLRSTADVIGSIDPQNLHRRIEPAKLPPELLPMGTRLNEMLDKIERAYALRHQFLADASHELRTPVAALVTTAEVSLRRPREADAYRQTLESCLSDARLLRQLVERLMEQCRADTLTHDETVEEVDVVPLLGQCADLTAALAEERSVSVVRQMPRSFCLRTQPGRLRSVVTNLLSNAVEYNRPGGTIELKVEPNGRFLHVIVADTGPGIAAEHVPFLFEPFYRADRARTGQDGHMGLGLSLVQAHVQALGGQIKVESTVGVGTRFCVDLPINKGPA
jgi:two-component system heavy metal sensor histidine kinase CusS